MPKTKEDLDLEERKKNLDFELREIPHAEHLTFVDRFKGQFIASGAKDELGRSTNPRAEWLRERAEAKKREYEERKRQAEASAKKAKK